MDAQAKASLERKAVGLLAILFLLALARGPLLKGIGLWQGGHARQETRLAASLSPAPPAPDHPVRSPLVEPAAAYTAGDLRDPMQSLLPDGGPQPEAAASLLSAKPEAHAAESVPSLDVRGVWLGGREPMALINGKIYGLNEMIAPDVRVRVIGPEGITIEHHGQLTMHPLASVGTSGAVQSEMAIRR